VDVGDSRSVLGPAVLGEQAIERAGRNLGERFIGSRRGQGEAVAEPPGDPNFERLGKQSQPDEWLAEWVKRGKCPDHVEGDRESSIGHRSGVLMQED